MDPIAATPAASPDGTTGMTRAAERQLRSTAQDVEAIFLTQMLQMMRRASSNAKGGPLSGQNQRVYQEMMDEHLARALAKGGGIGLGDMLVRDVIRRQGLTKKASSPAAAVPIGREGGLP
jgi:flagellar protein FlgJ